MKSHFLHEQTYNSYGKLVYLRYYFVWLRVHVYFTCISFFIISRSPTIFLRRIFIIAHTIAKFRFNSKFYIIEIALYLLTLMKQSPFGWRVNDDLAISLSYFQTFHHNSCKIWKIRWKIFQYRWQSFHST